jgi:hypothetical protein
MSVGKMKTRSYTYMLPMLSLSLSYYAEHLVNVFFGDESKPELNEHIFLLFKFSGDRKRPSHTSYLWIEEDLKKHPLYVEMYDPDPHHVMMAFTIPKEHIVNYKLFRSGKYSELSEEYKRTLLEYHYPDPVRREQGTLRKVLYKDESLYRSWEERLATKIKRGQEISSLPDVAEEIYNESMKEHRGLAPGKLILDGTATTE